MSAISARRRTRPAARGAQQRPVEIRPPHAPHLALVAGRPSEALEDALAGEPRARQLFGARLKATRDRRGITLATLAQSTKISASRFAELERGDFSHWPEGIYKRAFFRAYACGIGLPPEPTLGEFLQIFPDEEGVVTRDAEGGHAQPSASVEDARDPDAFRLMLAHEPAALAARAFGSRGAIDMVVALLLAGVVIWWGDVSVWAGVTLLALGCYPRLARLVRNSWFRMRR